MNNISRKFCQFSSNYLDALQSSFNEDIFIKVEKLALHLREVWKEGKNIYILEMEEAVPMLYTWQMIYIMEQVLVVINQSSKD